MRFLALAVVVAVAAVVVPADAGPKRGRIVRVERPRTGARGTPRICRMSDQTTGMCWGKPPVKGETAWVVGPESNGNPGNRGQIRIGNVTEASDSCSMPKYWTFELEPLDANLKDMESWQTWVLLDVDVGPRARAIDSSSIKSPDDKNSPWLAVDRGRGDSANRDGDADFIVTAFQCDETGAQITSGGTSGYCLDYWILSGHWVQVRRDIVVPEANCHP